MSRSICKIFRSLLSVLLLAAAGGAQALVIDDFSTNQAALTLTYPPAGTSTSSSASGGGILGGERDVAINLTSGVIAGNTMAATVGSGSFSYSQDATITGSAELQWDGSDGSGSLNSTGLGGVDLTVGGTQDALQLNLAFDDLPTTVTIEVWTDAGNASSRNLNLPGLIFAQTSFTLPYSLFTASVGAGADFTNVGAIRLTVGPNVTAPDVIIDSIQTTSTLTATQTVALQNDVNGDTQAGAGDTLRYTVVISNPNDAQAAGVMGTAFTSTAPAHTTLVVGSVTTSQGTVTSGNTAGDTSVNVDVGAMFDGDSVTITFDVVIEDPVTGGATQISAQGTVSATGSLTALPTDDPGVGGTSDPTVIALALPAATTTTVSADVNPVVVGNAVTFTATVASATSGNVVFYVDGNPAATLGVNGSGQATYTTSALTVGSHPVVAVYQGDASFQTSTSLPLTESVLQATGTVAVAILTASPTAGQGIEVGVTVTGFGTPTGSVLVDAGGGHSCLVTLAAGTGQCTLTGLTAGDYTVTALYAGDANNTASVGTTGLTVTAVVPLLGPVALWALGAALAGIGVGRLRRRAA